MLIKIFNLPAQVRPIKTSVSFQEKGQVTTLSGTCD